MSPAAAVDPIRVAIIEDQRHTREGLAVLVSGTPGFASAGVWRSMEDALLQLGRERPHVVLADIELPGMNGIDGVKLIKERFPGTEILMLSVYDDSDSVFAAICAGACGYLLKDTPPTKLLDAIREAAAGGAPMSPGIARKVVVMFQKVVTPKTEDSGLTARELEVLNLLASGHSYRSASDALGISFDTIRFHVKNIYLKLHVNSKSDAVLKALRAGLLD